MKSEAEMQAQAKRAIEAIAPAVPKGASCAVIIIEPDAAGDGYAAHVVALGAHEPQIFMALIDFFHEKRPGTVRVVDHRQGIPFAPGMKS